jgi:hypothetical protein
MKGWDSKENKRNRANQHYRMSELVLRIQILFSSSSSFLSFMFSLFFQKHGAGTQTSFSTMGSICIK